LLSELLEEISTVHSFTKLSDRSGQRACTEANDAVKPVTHKTQKFSSKVQRGSALLRI